jgi:hypothetical protein
MKMCARHRAARLLLRGGQVHVPTLSNCELLKDALPRLDGVELAWGRPILSYIAPGECVQIIASRSGSRYGSGLSRRTVDDAEDGRIGADSQRQCQQSNTGKTGFFINMRKP